jgi:hypothetical protein
MWSRCQLSTSVNWRQLLTISTPTTRQLVSTHPFRGVDQLTLTVDDQDLTTSDGG